MENLEYEKKYKQIYKQIYKSYFPDPQDEEDLKLPLDYKKYLEKGVDKLILKIPEEGINSFRDIEKINLRGETFNRIFSGKRFGNFYCKLEINIPKVYYGNNIKNIRDGEIIRKVINAAIREISSQGYEININLLELEYIEINKMVMLSPNELTQRAINILTDEIAMGHFKNTSTLYKKSTKPVSFAMGTKAKGVIGYDKTLEVLSKELNNDDNLSMSSLRDLAKGYKLFFRIEVVRSKESLKNLLDQEELKLSYLLDNTSKLIDKIFSETIKDAGLTEERVDTLNQFNIKNLAMNLKRYKRMYEKLFITRFIKDYQFMIWGEDQLERVAKHIGGTKELVYRRKNSLKRNFREIKTKKDISLDSYNFIEKLTQII